MRAARDAGAIALPFDPALAWLRPRVPAWWPKWRQGTQPSAQAASEFLRACIQQVKVVEASGSLGHLSVVIPVKKLEWLELECALVASSPDARSKLHVSARVEKVSHLRSSTTSMRAANRGERSRPCAGPCLFGALRRPTY